MGIYIKFYKAQTVARAIGQTSLHLLVFLTDALWPLKKGEIYQKYFSGSIKDSSSN
jgi:hypothetical protein